jgi:hypothetical protein
MPVSKLNREAVLRAISEFDRLGRTEFLQTYSFGQSRSYFLRHESKDYDSKAIVGVAHGFVGDGHKTLSSTEFTGGDATVAQALRNLGFEVEVRAPSPSRSAVGNLSPDGYAFWWVNNKQTFAHEIDGNYLWSPRERSDGGRNHFYDNMMRVRPGDVVFAFADGAIRAVGVCSAPANLAPRPLEFGTAGEVWSGEGWRLSVEFSRLRSTIRPKDHMDALAATLPDRYSPIRPDGNGNQGAYLAAVPVEMANVIIELLGSEWRDIDRGASIQSSGLEETTAASEEQVETAIRNRTDLTETEKLQLVKARRGQGLYRKNLEGFERACRLTGVSDLRHLRASHIKPWRASTSVQKLDGNNGLLLSPHVDHLFDWGFISFNDDGTLLVAECFDREILRRWGIASSCPQVPFRQEQLGYLAFHREFVFMR